jgi:hypothetical protein
MKTNNWHDIYHTMQVGESCYIITSSRKYASEQLHYWRKRNPDDQRWFRTEPAYCRHEGMEGMFITRLPEPSREQLAAQRAHERRKQNRETVTASPTEETCYAAL